MIRSSIALFFSCMFLIFPSYGQEHMISGSVRGADNEAVTTATVALLYAADSTLAKTEITGDNGGFQFSGIADGAYLLKVNALGYQPYSSKVVVSGADITLGNLRLDGKSNKLKELTIKGQKPLIEIRADKLVVNVENSIINTGSSALEILAKSPGVNVDQNDNISLKGRQGVNVMIDGKQMAVSGTDLANILKSMPSSNIKQVEVISNPGARYDAAGTAGIINIVTRRDQRLGLNGSVNLSYAQGVYPKYAGGFNLNYKNKKVTTYLSYNHSVRWWFNHLILDRKFYDNSDALQFSYRQDNFMKMPMKSHTGSYGIDYSINDKTIAGFTATAGTTGFSQQTANNSSALNGLDDVIYYFNTTGRHRQDYYNYSGNLNLRKRINEKGKLFTADVDYARYWSQSNQNFGTVYTRPDGSSYQPDYFMRSDLSGLTQIRSAKADYTHPIGEKAKLDAGVKSSYVTADNEPLFYQRTTGDFELDTKRSNHFIYREQINAAYVNGNKEWKKWSAQVGLRMENTNVEADQVTLDSLYKTSYTQLFPSLAVQHSLAEKHDVGITLSRRIQRPNYQELNPFKFFIDNTTYRAGYPYLRPALTYSAELSHTFNKKFITSVGYAVTSNNITEVIQPSDDEDSVTVQINKNLAQVENYSVSGAYPLQVRKWWTSICNFTWYYAYYRGNIANTPLSVGNPAYTISTSNNFSLPKGFRAELSLWYQSRQIYGYMNMKPMWNLSAGLQKNLLNDKATLRLNASDIFWKGLPAATSTYNSYREDFVVTRETRQVAISFSYRFGNTKMGAMRRRTGGAEDEKSRVGNS